MSVWTSVIAVIQFDPFPFDIDPLKAPPNLGIEFHRDSAVSEEVLAKSTDCFSRKKLLRLILANRKKCNIPCGSEGSLYTNLIEQRKNHFIATIWGSLRDYDDLTDILVYLNQITTGYEILSGIAEVTTPNGVFNYSYYSYYEDTSWALIIPIESESDGVSGD